MKFDREKYGRGAGALLQGNIVIFVEGKSNKLFYQNFDDLKRFSIMLPEQGGSSCLNIKSKVKENLNWYCILDKDYSDGEDDQLRVFFLNYYALENIVLLNHPKFMVLQEKLIEFMDNQDFNECKLKLLNIQYNRNKRENKEYSIIELGHIHIQYHNYINNIVENHMHYMQYISVKKIIETFDSYLAQKTENHRKRRYFEELYSKLKEQSFKYLFNDYQYEKIQKNLLNRIV